VGSGNEIEFNLSGRTWVNRTGYTKLCMRSSRDIDFIEPTGSTNECVVFYSSTGGKVYRPRLIVSYIDRNQSKIKNTGSTNISGYLLMQVQYYNATQGWVVDNDTINETNPRTIAAGDQLALDIIFNGNITTSDLVNGDGTYRVYAAFRDEEGDVLVCGDKSLLEAWYEFEVDTS